MKATRQHIDALKETGAIGPYSRLILKADLDVIIREMTEALEPCAKPVAKSEARRLAACYPTLRPSPEWLEQIEDALKTAPCDLIERAVAKIAGEATFPPNKAQVAQAVEYLTSVRRAVLNRAKAMMAEYERREAEFAEEEQRLKARAAFREKLAGRSPLQMIREEEND